MKYVIPQKNSNIVKQISCVVEANPSNQRTFAIPL